MRLNDLGLVLIITIVGACALAGVVSQIWLGKDNIVEQEAEAIIKEETCVSVDLSP